MYCILNTAIERNGAHGTYSTVYCDGHRDCGASQSNFQCPLGNLGKIQCLNFQELISKTINSTVSIIYEILQSNAKAAYIYII